MRNVSPLARGVVDVKEIVSDITVFSLLSEAYASSPDKEVIFDQYRRRITRS